MSTLALVRGAARVVLLACAGVATIVVPARADAPIVKLFAGPIAPETPCFPNLDPKYVTAPAGSFVDFCAAYYVSGGAPSGDDPKSVVFDTPRGFTATSQISPQCKIEAFAPASTADANCAPNTKIGDGQGLDPRRHRRRRDRAVGEGERLQPRLHRQGVGSRRTADGARARRHQVPAHQARRPHHHSAVPGRRPAHGDRRPAPDGRPRLHEGPDRDRRFRVALLRQQTRPPEPHESRSGSSAPTATRRR